MFFQHPFVAKRISDQELKIGIRGTDGESAEFVLPSDSVDQLLLTPPGSAQGWIGDDWIKMKRKDRVFFVSIRVTEAHRQVFNFSDSSFRKFCAQLRIGLAGMIPDTPPRHSAFSIPVRLDDQQIEEIRDCVKSEFSDEISRQLVALNQKLDVIIDLLQTGRLVPPAAHPPDPGDEESSSEEGEAVFVPSRILKDELTGSMSLSSAAVGSGAVDEAVDLLKKLRGKE